MSSKKFIVKEESFKRPIIFLKQVLNVSVSNKSIKKAIERGCLKINGRVERFSSVTLKVNDILEFSCNWESVLEKKQEKLPVLYEDDDFCIVDKPSGLLCEDKNIKMFFPDFMLAHRLDKETSGVLILAKNKRAKEMTLDLFSKRQVKKKYIALVDGEVQEECGEIESYLIKKSYYAGQTIWGSSTLSTNTHTDVCASAKNNRSKNCNTKSSNKSSTFKASGLYALTLYKRIKHNKYCSLLLCDIPTGRTHQIRVHLAEMGHAILGDYQYCKEFFFPHHVERIMLHSSSIKFISPFSSKYIEVFSHLPKDFSMIEQNV